MKVKDLISHLRTLDPERGVFILYDGFEFYNPVFDPSQDRLATCEDVSSRFAEISGVNEGDYLILIG